MRCLFFQFFLCDMCMERPSEFWMCHVCIMQIQRCSYLMHYHLHDDVRWKVQRDTHPVSLTCLLDSVDLAHRAWVIRQQHHGGQWRGWLWWSDLITTVVPNKKALLQLAQGPVVRWVTGWSPSPADQNRAVSVNLTLKEPPGQEVRGH